MTIEIPRNTSPDSHFESLWLECVNRIARGTSRDVYEVPDNPDKVLTVSNCQTNFSNWTEILVYEHFKESGHLAEILSWSWSGKFIVMERLAPLEEGDLSSYRFPSYLTDRKPKNYGKDVSGKIKALDYASLAIPVASSDFF